MRDYNINGFDKLITELRAHPFYEHMSTIFSSSRNRIDKGKGIPESAAIFMEAVKISSKAIKLKKKLDSFKSSYYNRLLEHMRFIRNRYPTEISDLLIEGTSFMSTRKKALDICRLLDQNGTIICESYKPGTQQHRTCWNNRMVKMVGDNILKYDIYESIYGKIEKSITLKRY